MAKKSRTTKKSLAQRIRVLEEHVARQEASAAPTPAEQRAAADRIREGLRARLARGPQPGLKQKTRADDPLLLELLARFKTMGEARAAALARQRAEDRRRYWALTTKRWRAIAGLGPQEEPENNIPIVSEETVEAKPNANDIASAFSLANDAGGEYPTAESFFNVRGESESSIRKETARRYGSPDD